MTHFVCPGSCQGFSPELMACEAEGCDRQWEMLEACDCADGRHGRSGETESPADSVTVKDSNGTVLSSGDEVVLIKDLTLRGTSRVLKRGTKVSNIQLTDNPEEVDCRIDGTAIVLRAEFLKKL